MLLLFTGGCFSVRDSATFTYEKLGPGPYRQMLQDSTDYYILDVRTPSEYRKSHIPGAINSSYFNFTMERDVDTLKREKIIFVYCQTCHRSPLTSKKLKRMGFRKVYDLKGGYQNWKP